MDYLLLRAEIDYRITILVSFSYSLWVYGGMDPVRRSLKFDFVKTLKIITVNFPRKVRCRPANIGIEIDKTLAKRTGRISHYYIPIIIIITIVAVSISISWLCGWPFGLGEGQRVREKSNGRPLTIAWQFWWPGDISKHDWLNTNHRQHRIHLKRREEKMMRRWIEIANSIDKYRYRYTYYSWLYFVDGIGWVD